MTSNPQNLEHTEACSAEQTENERGKPILSSEETFGSRERCNRENDLATVTVFGQEFKVGLDLSTY